MFLTVLNLILVFLNDNLKRKNISMLEVYIRITISATTEEQRKSMKRFVEIDDCMA